MPLKRTELKRKSWMKRGGTPLKKSGTTKAKKVERQKAFYASATWRRLKKEAKARAGNQCEYARWYYLPESDTCEWLRCPDTERLHVHHKSNARFGGDEIPEDLQVLCSYHHRVVEERDHPTRHPRRGRTP